MVKAWRSRDKNSQPFEEGTPPVLSIISNEQAKITRVLMLCQIWGHRSGTVPTLERGNENEGRSVGIKALSPLLFQLIRKLHLIDHGEGFKFGVLMDQGCIMNERIGCDDRICQGYLILRLEFAPL